ncbi:hypothetical protein SAMN04487788_1950 [Microbacterium testaceum StLB037]|uniref:Uncharacterized protein n=1 Tax=Microbacterium testaceum (strain StLB037) TaxID=979556 RepID=A0A1H0PQN9_MICTS|nr:hypothetical protein [Microbacterium testaceum]SDP07393.1 hypothetical protein SAMN04487788_1950 [Microbacterium testaceum StLB037]
MSNEDYLGAIVVWLIGVAVSLAALYWIVRAAIVSGMRAHAVAVADGTVDAAIKEANRRNGKLSA